MTTEAATSIPSNEAPAAATPAEGATPATEPAAAPDAAPADTTVLGGDADAAAADGDGDGEGEKPAGAPEKYELTAPDGVEFDKASFEAVEPVFREMGLTNDQAQQLVGAYAEKIVPQLQERAQQSIEARAIAQRKEWHDAFQADPEIGGQKSAETAALAAKAFDHYGIKKGEGLRLLLDESGLGNHPDLIRFISRVGRDLGEGSFERGGTAPAPLSTVEKFYGKNYGKPQAA